MDRGSGNVGRTVQGTIITLFLAVLGAAAIMFLVLRAGLLPTADVRSGVATSVGSPVPLGEFLRGTPTPLAAAPPQSTAVATRLNAPAGPRPPVDETVRRFLGNFEAGRYPEMYRQLGVGARQQISQERFVERYRAILAGATVHGIATSFPPPRPPPMNAERMDVQYSIAYKTARFGDLSETTALPLIFEENEWRVDWTPATIFRDLTHDRQVEVFHEDPVRGNIIDRNGVPLAEMARLPLVGVIPGALKDRARTIGELSKALGMSAEAIERRLAPSQPDWWVPLGVFPPERREELTARFGTTPGVVIEDRPTRHYPHGAVAPHIIGYVSPVLDEDLKRLAALGYGPEDYVGRAGVEAELEAEIAGVRGGRLYIVDAKGETVRVIAERPAKHGATIQLTLDIELQKKVEAILGDKVGSIVMLDPTDNGVLAMASNPRFDPNGFVSGIAVDEWKRLQSDPRLPFQHRPTLSAYPTGSVFKVITMAAGLERGGFTPTSPFTCNGTWSLPNSRIVFGDWVKTGHGRLDLTQGLTESCDIVFYELGRKLDLTDPRILPQWSAQFGLGEPTGIIGVPESAGTLPSPDWKEKVRQEGWFPGDAINLSIGQGYLEATPLQMANVYSTLANRGLVRTPLLVSRIGPAAGTEPVKELKAQERRRIPISPANLSAIVEGMRRVTQTPKGTAAYAFGGYRVPTVGKTGSAENQHKEAHAWFAGYGPQENPRAVVLVMIEGGEMGGTVAAPLGRKAFEALLGTG